MGSWTVGHLEKVRALSASGTMLAIGGVRTGKGSNLTLFDLSTRKVARIIEVPSHVLALAFVGNRVVAGSSDGWLRSYDAGTGLLGPQALAHATACLGVAASADGTELATVGADGVARLWSTEDLAPRKTWTLSPKALFAVALSPTALAASGDDGVVHVVTLATDARRDMAGHGGTVRSLAFTPRDGRLASAGDDGTVRLWFLDGAIEAEVRGANEQGHAGGANAIAFGPSPREDEGTLRLYSVGTDGKVKAWRLDERRKPKTFEVSEPLWAVAFIPSASGSKDDSTGTIVAGGDARSLLFITLDADGQPRDATDVGEHGFRVLEQQATGSKRPGREAAARALAALEEPEALALLTKLLKSDKEPDVRALAAKLVGEHGRREAKAALHERLGDSHDRVRLAALEALLRLESDSPVVALKAGLGSSHADIRRTAVARLPTCSPASPLVSPLLQGALTDTDASVRAEALHALVSLFPAGSFEPYRTAFERGTADVRVASMIDALCLGEAQFPGLWWMTARGLDDDDAEVRRFAFAVRVLTRPRLAQMLGSRFADYQRVELEVLRRVAVARRTAPGTAVTDDELAQARGALGLADGAAAEELPETQLEPLFLAMSCRASDTALLGTVAMLSLVEDPRAVGALLQLSLDPNPGIRAVVASVLGRLRTERAEQRLVSMLEDADADVRAGAADAWASHSKGRPFEFSRALLTSAFVELRVRGLSTLMQGPKSAEAEALLDHALEDESPKVRAEAFRTLWAWERSTPQAALDRALGARFSDLRLRAVEELEALAQVPKDDDAKPPESPPEWAVTRLKSAVLDREGQVGLRAFTAVRRLLTAERPQAVLLALPSTVPLVRRAAVQWAQKVKHDVESLRSPLLKAIQDEALEVRLGALEALDALLPQDNGPLTAGLTSDAYEVKVRAAELLAQRHDEVIIEPMRGLLLDRDLGKRFPPDFIEPLRERAASALATLGSGRSVALFATTLLKDGNSGVREQASRGLCNASDRNATGALLDALGHADVAVRSWAAEGLARNGDARGLPVLVGTLKDGHVPIREGAIRALVALGEAGFSGLLAGLDDAERRIQETFFAILLARDWKAYRKQEPPTLLTAALSARKPEIRFAAARALELRASAVPYSGYLVGVLSPQKPEKASELRGWPPEAERDHLMLALADMLGAELPADRYAAGQALLLRHTPLEYFAEVRRITKLKPPQETVVPDTTPRPPARSKVTGWLRSLLGEKTSSDESAGDAQLLWLAFGAYVGILREQASDELGHRVRRDCVDRLVALARAGQPPVLSVTPALVRALDDDDHLVREKAYAGLKALAGPDGQETAQRFALTCASADVANAALDELAARGEAGVPLITSMLNGSIALVRQHAFALLVRLAPEGSLEPLLAAFSCQHADLRLSVVERLAASRDPRVADALSRALESEHEDLRLRAAELLADRQDDRAVTALATLLRLEDEKVSARARAALVRLRTPAAVGVLAARLGELSLGKLQRPLIEALKDAGRLEGVDALLALSTSEEMGVVAFEAGMELGHFWRPDEDDPEENRRRATHTPRDGATLVRFFAAATQSKDPALRLAAVEKMDVGEEQALDSLLAPLFADRDVSVRVAAVAAYARRVEKHGAQGAPLVELVRQGARELLLGAAEGLAHLRHGASLRPLLLFVRAGEEGERERALRGLGTLGDPRALEELEAVASGGTPEVPFDDSMRGAALEGLGSLFKHLTDAEQRKRVWERLEAVAVEEGPLEPSGILALEAVGDGRAVARLEQLALDDARAADVRAQCVTALGKVGDPSAEATLARCLKDEREEIREQAKRALDRLFPHAPMRVALLAADSPHADIAAPAIAFLVAEAEPTSLLERLGRPLDASLRGALRLGLVKRPSLPTDALVQLTEASSPAAREDVAWIMAVHALGSSGLSEVDRSARARALAQAATKTAERWAKSLSTEKAAEERAWRRLLWAAVLNAAPQIVPVARATLAPGVATPASVRREATRALARAGGPEAIAALAEAAQDENGGVRAAALWGLFRLDVERARGLVGQVKPLDALALAPVAHEALLATEAGRQVSLPSIVAQARAEELKKLAQTGATDAVRRSALAALGRIGGEGVVAFLATLAFKGGDANEAEGEGDVETAVSAWGDVTMPGARRFESTENGSSKFWEPAVEGSVFKVRFGKIGTSGQLRARDLRSTAGAKKEAEHLIHEKIGKGYREVPPSGRRALVAVEAGAAPARKSGGGVTWGSEELRKAAFRAFKRAQRTTARQKAAPKWFSAGDLDKLAKEAGQQGMLAGGEVPSAPQKPAFDPAMSIDELELSVSTMAALRRIGLSSVGELIGALEDGSLEGLGARALREVKELLRALGVPLRDDDDDEGGNGGAGGGGPAPGGSGNPGESARTGLIDDAVDDEADDDSEEGSDDDDGAEKDSDDESRDSEKGSDDHADDDDSDEDFDDDADNDDSEEDLDDDDGASEKDSDAADDAQEKNSGDNEDGSEEDSDGDDDDSDEDSDDDTTLEDDDASKKDSDVADDAREKDSGDDDDASKKDSDDDDDDSEEDSDDAQKEDSDDDDDDSEEDPDDAQEKDSGDDDDASKKGSDDDDDDDDDAPAEGSDDDDDDSEKDSDDDDDSRKDSDDDDDDDSGNSSGGEPDGDPEKGPGGDDDGSEKHSRGGDDVAVNGEDEDSGDLGDAPGKEKPLAQSRGSSSEQDTGYVSPFDRAGSKPHASERDVPAEPASVNKEPGAHAPPATAFVADPANRTSTNLFGGAANGPGKPTQEAPPADDGKAAGPPASTGRAYLASMQPSAALAKVVGSEPKPRAEAIRRLREYIQHHGLQDRSNRTLIITDAALREVFGKDSISVFELTELVDRHLSPANSLGPKRHEKENEE